MVVSRRLRQGFALVYERLVQSVADDDSMQSARAEAKEKWGWLACWQDAVAEPHTFYVKIDDDIVFIEVNFVLQTIA